MKARSLPIPAKNPGHDVDAMYDTYLINFLKCSLAKESQRSQEDVRLLKSSKFLSINILCHVHLMGYKMQTKVNYVTM